VLVEFDELRRLLNGLAAELADDCKVSNLLSILHCTIFQLELPIEDVDVVVAVEFHLENALVKLDVVADDTMCLLKAECEVDEGDFDVNPLSVTHFSRDSVDGNCFIRKRNFLWQIDDVVK